jgi:hypothetical protein
MKITLSRGQGGLWYCLIAEDGREIIFQSDWDYPSLAGNFGYVPCECGRTDGTINCIHKTAIEMISAAVDFLNEHDGDSVEDPGYFE